MTDPTERLLYRVAVHFNAPSFCALGNGAERAAEVIALALPRSRRVDNPNEAAFIFRGKDTQTALPSGRPALFALDFTPAQWDELQRGAPMTFTNGHRIGIAVCRRMLPRQHFYVKIPLRPGRIR